MDKVAQDMLARSFFGGNNPGIRKIRSLLNGPENLVDAINNIDLLLIDSVDGSSLVIPMPATIRVYKPETTTVEFQGKTYSGVDRKSNYGPSQDFIGDMIRKVHEVTDRQIEEERIRYFSRISNNLYKK